MMLNDLARTKIEFAVGCHLKLNFKIPIYRNISKKSRNLHISHFYCFIDP